MAPDDWVGAVVARLRVEFPGMPLRFIEATVHRCLMSIELDHQRVVSRAAAVEDAARISLLTDSGSASAVSGRSLLQQLA